MSSTPRVQGPLFAHTDGQTSLTYSPDGKYLFTVGSNNIIRKYLVGQTDEPTVIDTSEENTGVAASNDRVVCCSEDGTVNLYSTSTDVLEKLLVRTSLPARDVTLSPDGNWVAVASDETVVKVVHTQEHTRILSLRQQSDSTKHVAFHPSGSYLAVSCADGIIYVYSLSSEEPELIKKVDGIINRVATDTEVSSKVAWHPDGRAFAAPTVTRDIIVVSRSDWQRQKAFASGHTADITDLAWSPNGAFLVSSALDGKVVLWETKTQTILGKYDHRGVISLAWHPTDNAISFVTNLGRLFNLSDFVPTEHADLLKRSVRPAPLLDDSSVTTTSAKIRESPRPRRLSIDSFDELLPSDLRGFEDDFIEDDDGAGYAEPNINGKRNAAHLDITGPASKRKSLGVWAPIIHEPFQPSSTPWRQNRCYLSLNMVGFVWTVNQETHHTITVEFYDREAYRDFHFTDPYKYDKACLNENGTLFSCQPADGKPAMLYYRPHETWTNRVEWRTLLPDNEEITSIALSENYIVVCTSNGYVRVYTLFGVPFRVYRQKHSPVVTCASFRDYILILGNGPVGADGRTTLTYLLENVKHDETLQGNDIVALPPDGELRGVFFSDNGDPMIYDSDGVLLVLQHWREPGQARWVPLLDTRTLERLAGGGKEETYWPVAVAEDKFHCIILKGGERYPYFPRPLLSEFDLKVPLSNKPEATDSSTTETTADLLEEQFVRESVLLSLQQDSVGARVLDASERKSMSQRENTIDRALLQLLIMECKDEDHGAKALEICGLFRQKRTLDLAIKAAVKFNQTVLAQKIGELRDAMEMDEDWLFISYPVIIIRLRSMGE